MGVDACVLCSCLRLGRTSKPPFSPERIVQRGGAWELDVPYKGNEADYHKLDDWKANACPHPRMVLVSASATWDAFFRFLTALGVCGPRFFPILLRQLSKQSGEMHSKFANGALEELHTFSTGRFEGKLAWLIDAGTGERIEQFIAPHRGVIWWGTGSKHFDIGVSKAGFFVRRKYGGWLKWAEREIFRCVRVEQILISSDGDDRQVKFIDRDSGRACVSSKAVELPVPRFTEKGMEFDLVRYANMEMRNVDPRDYAEITASFMRLFKASRDTSNPVFFG